MKALVPDLRIASTCTPMPCQSVSAMLRPANGEPAATREDRSRNRQPHHQQGRAEQQREGDTGHGRRARHGAQRRRVFVHFRSWASAVAFCAVKPKIDSCGLAPMLVGNTDPSITDRLASW